MSSFAGTDTARPGGPDRAPPAGVPQGDGQAPPPASPSETAGRPRPRPLFLLLGVVLAAALAVGLFTGVGTGGSSRPTVGGAVPGFSLPRLSGPGTVGVPLNGGADGRPIVLIFFASWCSPCQAEIPGLAALWRQEQATASPLRRVAVLGVDAFDPTSAARRFVDRAGVTFPVGTDRNYDLTEGTFAFVGLPEAVFVNGDGTIAALHIGAVSPSELRSWQVRLLSGG